MVISAVPGSLLAQAPETRADQIEAERAERAANYRPDKANPIVNAVDQFVSHGLTVWNALQGGTHGLALNVGGLAVGSEIAFGPEYIYRAGDYYHPRFIWDTYTVAAPDKSYRVQTGLQFPKLSHGRTFFNIDAYRYQYDRLLYSGTGSGTQRNAKSNYGQHESGIEAKTGITVLPKIRVGAVGAYKTISIGRGTSPNLQPTLVAYTAATAPGLGQPSDFLTGGFYAEYENRDRPGDPGRGQYLSAQVQDIRATQRSLGSFLQYDFAGELYVPFWNHSKTLALRARASLTTPHKGSTIPFYLLPHLGGPDDLRGYDEFRFHDQNVAFATVEYRWAAVPLLDMDVFVDGGKVYSDAYQVSLSHIVGDVGAGVRVKSGNSVPVRFDIGVSREGVKFWLIFLDML